MPRLHNLGPMALLEVEAIQGHQEAVRPATTCVFSNEPAFLIAEVNQLSPDYHEWRRYQIVLVNRGDRLTEFRRDLGPRSSHKAGMFQIPLFWRDSVSGRAEGLHTVAEALALADEMRSDLGRRVLEPPSDFARLLSDLAEEIPKRQVRRATFGPGGSTTRGEST